MGYTFAEKALARAAGLPGAVAGQIVDACPDVALSHDNSAAIAGLFHELGAGRVLHPERLFIVLDHAVPAPTTQHAANHAAIRRFVAEQGIGHFFDAGRGICHQVLSEEAGIWPGGLVLGADSHTTHAGWLGAFAAGIGRSEMAAIWATGQLWLRVPETIRIDLTGTLAPWVTAKDLGLWMLRRLAESAAGPEGRPTVYAALEIGGPGLASLSIASRMVLPNLLAEAGAKNAYLEPDEAVFDWLARRRARAGAEDPGDGEDADAGQARLRGEFAAGALYPDPGALYSACHTFDLAAVEPAVACPGRPDQVVPIGQVAGTPVQQAFLGTCTNGRLEDLAAAAAILRGPDGRARQVAPGTRLLIIPASSVVLREAIAAGYIETFLAAGAMIGTPGCGPCMGNHLGIPAPGEVTISSANRNFRGRMGTPEAEMYLASPAVVAASAVAGRIADPREVSPREGITSRTYRPELPGPPRRAAATQETPQRHAEAGSLTALDESAWQAEASAPGVPRRILRCDSPQPESSCQPATKKLPGDGPFGLGDPARQVRHGTRPQGDIGGFLGRPCAGAAAWGTQNDSDGARAKGVSSQADSLTAPSDSTCKAAGSAPTEPGTTDASLASRRGAGRLVNPLSMTAAEAVVSQVPSSSRDAQDGKGGHEGPRMGMDASSDPLSASHAVGPARAEVPATALAVSTDLPAPEGPHPAGASSHADPSPADGLAGRLLSGRAWKYGDDVNTDVIFPGKYTYTITDPAEMARHALEDLDPAFADAVQPGDILVGGRNWGCGSSREQAATCLREAGVRAIVAASFARIFFRNAVNSGLLPVACPAAAEAIRPGETVTVNIERCAVRCAAGEFSFPPLSPSLREIVAAGGLIAMLRQEFAQQWRE